MDEYPRRPVGSSSTTAARAPAGWRREPLGVDPPRSPPSWRCPSTRRVVECRVDPVMWGHPSPPGNIVDPPEATLPRRSPHPIVPLFLFTRRSVDGLLVLDACWGSRGSGALVPLPGVPVPGPRGMTDSGGGGGWEPGNASRGLRRRAFTHRFPRAPSRKSGAISRESWRRRSPRRSGCRWLTTWWRDDELPGWEGIDRGQAKHRRVRESPVARVSSEACSPCRGHSGQWKGHVAGGFFPACPLSPPSVSILAPGPAFRPMLFVRSCRPYFPRSVPARDRTESISFAVDG